MILMGRVHQSRPKNFFSQVARAAGKAGHIGAMGGRPVGARGQPPRLPGTNRRARSSILPVRGSG
jgi:hypothetical protein